MRTILSVFTFLMTVTLSVTGARAAGSDVEALAALIEGRFDNELQVFFEKEQKIATAGRMRAHWSIRRIAGAPRFLVLRTANAETKEGATYVSLWRLLRPVSREIGDVRRSAARLHRGLEASGRRGL
ncbi:MAG: hypothetical protein HC779_02525 [Phyllobacteriaceae bacterium]|nr:hypothetical protein [Phyllobacteriaceae bacterium]